MNSPDTQFKLRLPAELKTKLDEQAEAAGRSLSAEIVYRLELSFAQAAAVAQYRSAAERGLDMTKRVVKQIEDMQQQIKARDEEVQRMTDFINSMGDRINQLQQAVAKSTKDKPKP